MKEVIAIIRPEKCLLTAEAVRELGLGAPTEQRVLGRGRQGGLRYLRPEGGQQSQGVIEFLPKRMLTWLVTDEKVEAIVEVIIRTNRTSTYGDGKIFVCPVDNIQSTAESPGVWQS
ncbi:MAG: P-II family nitrogen regulator [Chloroflexi bacterium]|nr:P-II family nitrogen regulator [Chloroflexota bacterium]